MRAWFNVPSRADTALIFDGKAQLIASIADPTAPVYSFQARRPPTRMPRGLSLLQQLQWRDSGFVQSGFAGGFLEWLWA